MYTIDELMGHRRYRMKNISKSILCILLSLVMLAGNVLPVYAATKKVAPPTPYGVIVLGDSRTEYMAKLANTIQPNEFFVYGYGMGYDWMVLVGIPQVNTIIASHPEYTR